MNLNKKKKIVSRVLQMRSCSKFCFKKISLILFQMVSCYNSSTIYYDGIDVSGSGKAKSFLTILCCKCNVWYNDKCEEINHNHSHFIWINSPASKSNVWICPKCFLQQQQVVLVVTNDSAAAENINNAEAPHINIDSMNGPEVPCYVCKKVSLKPWHRKIQCSNNLCKKTFHLHCVSLEELPKYKWFCMNCRKVNSWMPRRLFQD